MLPRPSPSDDPADKPQSCARRPVPHRSPRVPPREDQNWRRQAALFGAGVSALIGLGFGVLFFLSARERAARDNDVPLPAPAAQVQTPEPGATP